MKVFDRFSLNFQFLLFLCTNYTFKTKVLINTTRDPKSIFVYTKFRRIQIVSVKKRNNEIPATKINNK